MNFINKNKIPVMYFFIFILFIINYLYFNSYTSNYVDIIDDNKILFGYINYFDYIFIFYIIIFIFLNIYIYRLFGNSDELLDILKLNERLTYIILMITVLLILPTIAIHINAYPKIKEYENEQSITTRVENEESIIKIVDNLESTNNISNLFNVNLALFFLILIYIGFILVVTNKKKKQFENYITKYSGSSGIPDLSTIDTLRDEALENITKGSKEQTEEELISQYELYLKLSDPTNIENINKDLLKMNNLNEIIRDYIKQNESEI